MRLFIAVELDEVYRSKILDIQKELSEDAIKLVEPQNLHVTLKFLGEVPDEKSGEIVDRLKKVRVKPFDMKIGKVGAFPNMSYIRVVWVGVDGALAGLAAEVESSLQGLGYIEKNRYGFSAHMTIARVKTKPKHLTQKIQKFTNVEVGTQRVESFSLVKSTLTPKGPVYERIAEFKLS